MRLRLHERWIAMVAALILAGCGGGGGSAPAPAPKSVVAPSATASAAPGTAPLSIVVKIPKKGAKIAGSGSRRRPAYVSSATQYMEVTVTPAGSDGGNVISACTQTEGPAECSATIGLPVSPANVVVTVSIQLWDGYPGDSSLLSEGTTTLQLGSTYFEGQVNAISPTLDAVVNELSFTVASGSLTNGASGSLTLDVLPVDADDYVIQYNGYPSQRLIDSSGTVIGDFSGAPTDIGVTFNPSADFSTTGPVAFNSTAGYLQVPILYSGAYTGGSFTYTAAVSNSSLVSLDSDVYTFNPATIDFTVAAVSGSSGVQDYVFDDSESQIATAGTLELEALPAANPVTQYVVGLTSNYGYSGSFTENDTCSSIATITGTTAQGGATKSYLLTFLAASVPNYCTMTVTDSHSNSAELFIFIDETQITAQGRTRRK